MSEYKVVKADHKKDFSGNRGEMSVYVLELDDGNGAGITEKAELCQMQKTAPPVAGETINGQIIPADNPEWLPKFKKEYSGGFSGAGSKGGATFKPRDPSEIAGARHAHNLLVAAHSFEPLPFDVDSHSKLIQERIDDLEAFACVLDEKTAAISDAAKGS